MALIDDTFVRNIMGAEEYNRTFDRDATGTIDTAFLNECIDVAENEADTILNGGGSILLPLDRGPSTVDRSILRAIARMTIYEATRNHSSDGMAEKSPWRQGYEDAIRLLKELKADLRRARTAQGGERPQQRANYTPTTNADGNTGPTYARILDGRDTSGY